MTPTLHPDFRECFISLKRHRVRFVVVGAYVLASLGRPRYSDDLDIFVAARLSSDGATVTLTIPYAAPPAERLAASIVFVEALDRAAAAQAGGGRAPAQQ